MADFSLRPKARKDLGDIWSYTYETWGEDQADSYIHDLESVFRTLAVNPKKGRPCDLPIVGDIRGAGYFYGVELVKDKETKGRFSREECDRLMRDFLSHRLFELGLICRTEDRAEPIIQLAPPLVAGPEEFREIARILRKELCEAQNQMG